MTLCKNLVQVFDTPITPIKRKKIYIVLQFYFLLKKLLAYVLCSMQKYVIDAREIPHNVCFTKIRSKLNSVLLLCLL